MSPSFFKTNQIKFYFSICYNISKCCYATSLEYNNFTLLKEKGSCYKSVV